MLQFVVWCVCKAAVKFSRFAEWLADKVMPVDYGPRIRECCKFDSWHAGACSDGVYRPIEPK